MCESLEMYVLLGRKYYANFDLVSTLFMVTVVYICSLQIENKLNSFRCTVFCTFVCHL